MNDINGIMERAEERHKQFARLIEKMLDKSEVILQAGQPHEQTNEEWIKSLDTEGMVDYLYEVHKGGNSVERQAWIEKHKERVKMQIRGWLKQPHKPIS